MIHRHRYTDVSTDYIEGRDVDNVQGSGQAQLDALMKLIGGYTVIHQRCDCGKYRTQEVLGRLTS